MRPTEMCSQGFFFNLCENNLKKIPNSSLTLSEILTLQSWPLGWENDFGKK